MQLQGLWGNATLIVHAARLVYEKNYAASACSYVAMQSNKLFFHWLINQSTEKLHEKNKGKKKMVRGLVYQQNYEQKWRTYLLKLHR